MVAHSLFDASLPLIGGAQACLLLHKTPTCQLCSFYISDEARSYAEM